MTRKPKPRWLKRLGNSRVKMIWDVMIKRGAILPDGEPMTTELIHNLTGKTFSMQQLSNHLSKKPQFERVGTKRIPESFGSQTYPVALWLADPDAYTPPTDLSSEGGGEDRQS